MEVTLDTWLSSLDNKASDGNSSMATSSLLAKLDSILQTFPQFQPDDVLQHLPELNPQMFLALNNANDTLTHSQMLKAPNRPEFLKAKESELQGLLDIHIHKTKICWNKGGIPLVLSVVWLFLVYSPSSSLPDYRLCVTGPHFLQGSGLLVRGCHFLKKTFVYVRFCTDDI